MTVRTFADYLYNLERKNPVAAFLPERTLSALADLSSALRTLRESAGINPQKLYPVDWTDINPHSEMSVTQIAEENDRLEHRLREIWRGQPRKPSSRPATNELLSSLWNHAMNAGDVLEAAQEDASVNPGRIEPSRVAAETLNTYAIMLNEMASAYTAGHEAGLKEGKSLSSKSLKRLGAKSESARLR